MGAQQSRMTAPQAGASGGLAAEPPSDLYDVRVVEGGCENPRCLHFVDPAGQPSWHQGEHNYVCGLPTFDAAQRVCRQIMVQPQFVPGTRVQFFKGGRRIKHSTVLKP